MRFCFRLRGLVVLPMLFLLAAAGCGSGADDGAGPQMDASSASTPTTKSGGAPTGGGATLEGVGSNYPSTGSTASAPGPGGASQADLNKTGGATKAP